MEILANKEERCIQYISMRHLVAKFIGEIYESIGLVAKAYGKKNGSKIVLVCKGKRKTAYGSRWAYYKGGDANVS